MTGFKHQRLLVSLMLVIVASSAQAADTTITITGKVTAAACTIDNSGAYNVVMPDVTAGTLNAANSHGTWKPFNVTLSNCPAGTSSVTATFSGTADVHDNSKYANASGAGYAENVAVELQRVTGNTSVGNGGALTISVDAGRNATFDLQARPYSMLGNATVGNISTVVLMNFAYN